MHDDIQDIEDVRRELRALLSAADGAGVSQDALVGLLTAHLAARRGRVRLPLSMPPARAREFLDRAREHEGETMEVELLVTDEVLSDVELQLQAFERD